MIICKNAPPWAEVTCEPDDDYEYLKCESSVAGLFFLRVRDGWANIFIVENDGTGKWSDRSYDMAQMKNRDTCSISVVTEKITRTLPTKQAFEAARNN